jgi:heptosyltransferase-2
VKTLVIQTGFLGDLVLTLPLVRVLHEARPDSPITLAVREGLGDLVRDQVGVAETIVIRKRQSWLEQIASDRARFKRLRRGGYQTVYLAHRSFRTGLHAWSTRAPRRVGFAGAPSSWACTQTVRYASERHVSERFLALAEQPAGASEAQFYVVAPTARDTADRLLSDSGIDAASDFVTVAPGSVWATKRWTDRGFTELTRWLVSRDLAVVLVGTAADHEICERVRAGAAGGVINLAGRTGPAELARILERGVALLGNDSGPGHLAAAVGTPVIAVFGPTDPARGFRPLGERVLTVDVGSSLDCRPCSVHGARRCPQGHHRCMIDLDPADVIARIQAWPLNPLRSPPDKPSAPHE